MKKQKTYSVAIQRCQLVRETSVSVAGVDTEFPITQPEQVAGIFRQLIGSPDREHFVALLLDTRLRPLGVETVSIGTLNTSLVHPREVFKAAILASAASLILGHNHPSGDPTPSEEDRELTRRLVEAGRLLGIEVTDHVVLGDKRHYSFQENGLM